MVEECNEGSCAEWTSWGVWGECSATCGGGERRRRRRCTSATGNAQAALLEFALDFECEGEPEETGVCNQNSCAEWTSWGEWGACSASCGGGERSRQRRCTSGGLSIESTFLQCPGEAREADSCGAETCPVLLEVTSSGLGGEHQGFAFGVYQQVEGSDREGSPVYKQRQEDGLGCVLLRYREHWVVRLVSPGGGEGDTVLQAAVRGTSALPPAAGWTYLDVGSQAYLPDPSLAVVQVQAAGCGEVGLVLGAGAGQAEVGGLYRPTGGWSAGRQVFQQVASPNLYLMVTPRSFQWKILLSLDPDTKARVASASAGAICPCHLSNAISQKYKLSTWVYKSGPGTSGDWMCFRTKCSSPPLALTCSPKI